MAIFDTRANSPATFLAGCFMRLIMSTEMMGATDMTVSCDVQQNDKMQLQQHDNRSKVSKGRSLAGCFMRLIINTKMMRATEITVSCRCRVEL
jgi:hypothetical protein